jgi:hypothetical protein
MSLNLKLRIGALAFMFATAFLSLGFFHFFGTAWSNRCDPDNAHFYLLKNDPVVSFRAPGELFTSESDGPDNSWMCVNPRLEVSHYRSNQDKLFAELEDNLLANGWKWYPEIELQTRGQSGEELAKYAGDLRLTALLFKEDWSSVKLVLEAPPMHLGESGFSSP